MAYSQNSKVNLNLFDGRGRSFSDFLPTVLPRMLTARRFGVQSHHIDIRYLKPRPGHKDNSIIRDVCHSRGLGFRYLIDIQRFMNKSGRPSTGGTLQATKWSFLRASAIARSESIDHIWLLSSSGKICQIEQCRGRYGLIDAIQSCWV